MPRDPDEGEQEKNRVGAQGNITWQEKKTGVKGNMTAIISKAVNKKGEGERKPSWSLKRED